PIAVVDGYVDRLVAQGLSVALVSQAEEQQAGKGMVARQLDRIVTPGVTLLSNGDGGKHQGFVAGLSFEGEHEVAIAFTDVQSGIVTVRDSVTLRDLNYELARISPAEIVVPKSIDGKRFDRRFTWVKELE